MPARWFGYPADVTEPLRRHPHVRDETPDESTGATTLLDVLDEVAQEGFSSQLVVTDDGNFRCTGCWATESIENLDVVGFRRLEGASDPADMLIVVWGTCGGCGSGGVATIGYSPSAGDADVAALERLDFDAGS